MILLYARWITMSILFKYFFSKYLKFLIFTFKYLNDTLSIWYIGGDSMISKDNDRVIVTISKEVKAKLTKLAQEDKRTISNYLNVVITNYLNSIEEDDK